MANQSDYTMTTNLQPSKKLHTEDDRSTRVKTHGVSFLDLPGELRNKIYHLYFEDIRSSHLTYLFGRHDEPWRSQYAANTSNHYCTASSPAYRCKKTFESNGRIFFTARQIYEDASSLFYKHYYPQYKFYFGHFTELKEFWHRIGARHPDFFGSLHAHVTLDEKDGKRFDTLCAFVFPDIRALYGEVAFEGQLKRCVLRGKDSSTSFFSWSYQPYDEEGVRQEWASAQLGGRLGNLKWMDQLMAI
jgi:hypothetical protein